MSKQGWHKLVNARKWHFFDEDGRSLCGKWLTFANPELFEDEQHDHPENCAACRRAHRKKYPEAYADDFQPYQTKINVVLSEWYDTYERRQWWRNGQLFFDGLTPTEMLSQGRGEEVLEFAKQINEGLYL